MSDMVRTPEQILSIMKAAAIGDMCFSHMLGFIRVGMSEKEAAAEIDRVLFSMGAEKLAFPTICVSGERTNLPHGEPTEKLIEKGDLVTMDFGAVIDGCCGDMTRTVAMGSVTDFQRHVYGTVLAAQLAAIKVCIAGARCFDVDKAARGVIEDAGFGEEYCHGTGHGVGAEVHEPPALNRTSTDVLAENMAVTIEPGIYIPGKFGVRIEDLAIVTKFGIINTVKSAKELIVL